MPQKRTHIYHPFTGEVKKDFSKSQLNKNNLIQEV